MDLPATRPLTIDDIVSAKHPADCQINPYDRRVAFAMVDAAHTGKLPPSSIWLIDPDAGMPARRITSGPRHDSYPRWSPDGSTIAFLSDRAQTDTAQVCVLQVFGGEAVQLSSFAGGVTRLAWAPDCRRIACLVPEQAEGASEPHGAIAPARTHGAGKPRSALYVLHLDAEAREVLEIREAAVLIHVLDFDWSHDGTSLVVAGTPEPRIDEAFSSVQIYRYSFEDGARLLTTTAGGADVQPRWSPDGQRIAFRSGAGKTYLAHTVHVMNSDGTDECNVTASLDCAVHGYAWLPDSRSLLLALQHDMQGSLRRLDIASGSLETWTDTEHVLGRIEQTYFGYCSDANTLAYIREHDHGPRSLWVGTPKGKFRRVHPKDAAERTIALGEVRQLSWRSGTWAISGSLVLPVGYEPGRRYPLVVQVHGGPASVYQRGYQAAWNEWGQLLATHGMATLRANPRGSGGRGLEFVSANWRDWGGGDWDDIARGIDHVVELGIADPSLVGIGGWSYGGFLTAWAVTHSDSFRCAVIGAPVLNLFSFFGTTDIPYGFMPRYYFGVDPYQEPEVYRAHSPIFAVDELRVPTLLLHGESDVRVPLTQSIEWHTAVRGRGLQVELVTYPDEDHAIKQSAHQRDVLERVLGWFTAHL